MKVLPKTNSKSTENYSPRGIERLRAFLPEVPPEDFTEGMHISQLPYLFTVETFVKIVETSLAEQAGTGE